jgi:hypothetical protein
LKKMPLAFKEQKLSFWNVYEIISYMYVQQQKLEGDAVIYS